MVVERVPIMRKAIHFTREPITQLDLLKWDDVYKKLNNYIKYASNQVACTATCRYSISEDLYQEGLLLLYQLWEQYNYLSLSEFLAVSKTSIWRKLRKTAWKPGLPVFEDDAEGDDSPSSIVDMIPTADDSFSTVYEQCREQEVLNRLGNNDVAKNIFLELLSPSQETLWQQQMDFARKETVKSMGYRINVPKTVDLKGIYIQKALKLSNKLFKENFKLLQSIVYDVYAEDTEIKNYMASLEVA